MVVPGICALLLAYFAYHSQTGRYSIQNMGRMEEEALRLEFQLVDLKLERKSLEAKVGQLTSGTLERDALDEAVRRHTGMAKADELVILVPPTR